MFSDIYMCLPSLRMWANKIERKQPSFWLWILATLAFWIIIKYYQFTMMVSTIVLIAHYTRFLSSNEYVGTFVVFFQTINSSCIAIRFLLGSFKLDKRILSHCNDRVLKQHTCKHACSTCHILYQCNNKRARWVID